MTNTKRTLEKLQQLSEIVKELVAEFSDQVDVEDAEYFANLPEETRLEIAIAEEMKQEMIEHDNEFLRSESLAKRES